MHNIELLTIVSAALNIGIGHCIEEYMGVFVVAYNSAKIDDTTL